MDSKAKISMVTILSAFAMWIIIAVIEVCTHEYSGEEEIPFDHDYDKIAESGILNVALAENATEYCIFNANPRGFQYETFEDFAKMHNLELNIIPVATDKEAENLLDNGLCDIIVKHTPKIDSSCMTIPLLETKHVILSRSKEIPDTLYISQSLANNKLNGHLIITIDSLSPEKIAKKVASGELNAIVCDHALALTYRKAYPLLEIDTSICLTRQIVWKTHHDATILRDSINSWLTNEKQKKEYKLRHQIYYSYININVSSKYYSGKGNLISAYDELIKKCSKKLKWDWRFVASLICEESRFNPDISNPSGAYGLMQLMPTAYQKFAHDSADISLPEVQLNAGINHIAYLKKKTPETITDTSVIIRYVLMGYNAGLGHAEDAYKLATKHTGNPNSWKNLAEYMKLLNEKEYYSDPEVKCGKYKGYRTVVFTNNIIERYKHYRNLIRE